MRIDDEKEEWWESSCKKVLHMSDVLCIVLEQLLEDICYVSSFSS